MRPPAYDPFAAGAPVTVYGSGIRNAYDLLWHSNGSLYVPTNGSAAGGNVPAVPTTLPAQCAKRPDGGYTGPTGIAGITNNPNAETDYVFRVRKGKYYGHPNPSRCEYILNNGNPTAAVDPFETARYPVGTAADPNYDVAGVFDAGQHASANGVIEYKSNAFGGALKGKLLYVRYSQGQDIVTFDVAADGGLSNRKVGTTGLTGFNQPLDVTEDPATGNLYVTQLGNGTISLVKPRGGTGGPGADVTPRLVLSGPVGATSPAANATVTNTGAEPLTIPAGGLGINGAGRRGVHVDDAQHVADRRGTRGVDTARRHVPPHHGRGQDGVAPDRDVGRSADGRPQGAGRGRARRCQRAVAAVDHGHAPDPDQRRRPGPGERVDAVDAGPDR